MIPANWVQSNTKSANTKIANTLTRFVQSLSQITSTSISTFYPRPRNIFFLLTNKNRLKLMKKKRYFYCQQPGHTTSNCLKSIIQIATIAEIVSIVINNNKILEKE